MKLHNPGAEFKISYDYKEYTIPKGDMEVADNGFATFIVNKTRRWGIPVTKIGETKIEAVAAIAPIKPLEVPTEDIKEEVEEKNVTKTSKKTRQEADVQA